MTLSKIQSLRYIYFAILEVIALQFNAIAVHSIQYRMKAFERVRVLKV